MVSDHGGNSNEIWTEIEGALKVVSLTFALMLPMFTAACSQPAASERAKSQTQAPSPSTPPSDTAVTPLPVAGAFLVAPDLFPTDGYKLNSKPLDQVLKTLDQTSVFYNNQPKSQLALPANIMGCFSELDNTLIDANKVSAKIIKNLDVSECVKQMTDPRLKINSLAATLKVYMYLACNSGDVSGLKGKSFKTLQDVVLGKSGCSEGSIHIQFLSEQTAEAVYNGLATTFKRRVVSLDGTNDLTGCKFTVKNNIETRADDCINFAKDDYSFTTPLGPLSFYDIYSYKFVGVTSDVSSDDNTWRSTGKIELSVNSWTGEVSFTGPKTSPTYALQDAANNAPVSGSLTAAAPGPELLTPSLDELTKSSPIPPP